MSNSYIHFSTLLMGGFGNQIFQFCKTKDLETRGYSVSIDTSNFEKFKNVSGLPYIHREQVFPVEYFGFQESKNYIKKILDVGIKLNKLTPSFLDFAALIHDNNINQKSFRKYNRLIGYFQDVDLIYKHKEYLINSLSKNNSIKAALESKPQPGTTLLHVRRGDYLNMNEELKIDFYIKALTYLKKNINNFSYEVFTDDYKWTSKQKIFQDSLKIHSDDNTVSNTISMFVEMLNFENFIVGNSTFSLIPALLKESNNSKIIIANPWFRNKDRNLNFRNNWIRLKNQY